MNCHNLPIDIQKKIKEFLDKKCYICSNNVSIDNQRYKNDTFVFCSYYCANWFFLHA